MMLGIVLGENSSTGKNFTTTSENVVFEQMFCANSPQDSADHKIMSFRTLKGTSAGEEFHAHL